MESKKKTEGMNEEKKLTLKEMRPLSINTNFNK